MAKTINTNEHPLCCLCGGHRPTETVEHFPPKVFFQSPSQYPRNADHRFPACLICQARSRQYDQFFSMLTYTPFSGNMSACDRAHFDKVFRGVANNMGQEFVDFGVQVLSRSPNGQTSTFDLMTGATYKSMVTFGWKLFATLHYKHMNAVLSSRKGLICFSTKPNIHYIEAGVLRKNFEGFIEATSYVPLESSNKNTPTSTHFQYRAGMNPSGNGAIFIARLNSFALLAGFTFPDVSRLCEQDLRFARNSQFRIRPMPNGPKNVSMTHIQRMMSST